MAIERQVVEAHAHRSLDAAAQAIEHALAARFAGAREREGREPRVEFADRHVRDFAQAASAHLDCERFAAKPRAAAGLARIEAPITRDRDAGLHLVAPPFEPLEVALHAVPGLVARNHPAAVDVAEIAPRHVGREPAVAAGADQILLAALGGRRRKRLDRVLGERARGVRDHALEIERLGAAEALTTRARAERAVERKQRGLGRRVALAANVAAEALAKQAPFAADRRHDELAAAAHEAVRDRLGQARADIARDFEAIDYEQRLAAQSAEPRRGDFLHVREAAVCEQQAAQALP